MHLKSVFGKFLIPVILILCLFACSILLIIGSLISGAYAQEVIDENDNTCRYIAKSVESFIGRAYAVTEELAYSDEILSMDTERQNSVVRGMAGRNDYFELVYVQDMNGDQTSRSSGVLANRANRWWFQQMIKEQKPFVSKSYYSVSTGMSCASVFLPLQTSGQMVGILATDIRLDSLQTLVEENSSEEDGKVTFIIDGEGTVIAHPNSEFYQQLYNYKNLTKTVAKTDASGKTLYDASGNVLTEELPIEISDTYADVIAQVLKGNQGKTVVEDNGVSYYASYTPVQLDGASDAWGVVTLRDKVKAKNRLRGMDRAGMMVVFSAIFISAIIISFVTKIITTPIKQSLTRLQMLSKGDLTTEVPKAKSHDEGAQLLMALDESIRSMNELVTMITVKVDEIAKGDFTNQMNENYPGDFNRLAVALDTIMKSMRQTLLEINHRASVINANIGQLDMGIQMLADGTTNQASAIEELSATLTDVSQRVTDNAANAKESDAKMQQVGERIEQGRDDIRQLSASIDAIEENSNAITGITKTIQDVANQTNLLAMNATIEAARAGEYGKGFAVVAAKIRNLAEECTKAANNTSELAQKTKEVIADSKVALQNTVQSVRVVSEKSEDVGAHVREISEASGQQAEAIAQIAEAVSQISDVTQANSSSAAQSAAASNAMKQQVEELEKTLQYYKL